MSSCMFLVKTACLCAGSINSMVSAKRVTIVCISILSRMKLTTYLSWAHLEARSKNIVHILREDSARMAVILVIFSILMIMEKVQPPKYVQISYLVSVLKALTVNALTYET